MVQYAVGVTSCTVLRTVLTTDAGKRTLFWETVVRNNCVEENDVKQTYRVRDLSVSEASTTLVMVMPTTTALTTRPRDVSSPGEDAGLTRCEPISWTNCGSSRTKGRLRSKSLWDFRQLEANDKRSFSRCFRCLFGWCSNSRMLSVM